MTKNHIIIGLGGTGGKIIKAFRKQVFLQFRDLNPKDVNIEYLYVDSDPIIDKQSDPSWKILGKSVQLPQSNLLNIQGANVQTRLDNLHDYPGIAAFIEPKEQIQKVIKTGQGADVLGGQKRRLGRLLLACKIHEFNNKLESLHKRITEEHSNDQEVTFHVCCGLAGGTGSGTIVDVVSQIRAKYPYSEKPPHRKIICYLFLPEEFPGAKDMGKYHANAYAALMELNALVLGEVQIVDISGQKVINNPKEVRKLNERIPFNGCYLFTNVNEKNVSIKVDEDLPEIVSNFLFTKIVRVRNLNWPDLTRWENNENVDDDHEANEFSKRPERSLRFLSFGMKSLNVPEKEIEEYFVYHFCRSAILQLQFNKWTDDYGYIEPQHRSESNFKAEWLNEWKITLEHLRLSIHPHAEARSNKPFKDDWSDIANNFFSDSKNLLIEERVDELKKWFLKRYREQFRNLGVDQYFTTQRENIKEYYTQSARLIERSIFEKVISGTISIKEAEDIVQRTIKELEQTSSKIANIKKEIAKKKSELSDNFKDAEKKYKEHGFLSAILGESRESIAEKYCYYICNYYLCETDQRSYDFATEYINLLINELRGCLNLVFLHSKG
jgi:hypothetical protein